MSAPAGDEGVDEGADAGAAGPRFAPVARRLAGLAGWHLGWSPAQFWAATPDEMETIVRAMLGVEDGAAGAAPPSRAAVARLQEMFPDG